VAQEPRTRRSRSLAESNDVTEDAGTSSRRRVQALESLRSERRLMRTSSETVEVILRKTRTSRVVLWSDVDFWLVGRKRTPSLHVPGEGNSEQSQLSSRSLGSHTDHQRRHTLTKYHTDRSEYQQLNMSELEKRHASIVWGEECWIPVFYRSSRAASISYELYRVCSPELVPCYTLLSTL